jgi:hypothetical protein
VWPLLDDTDVSREILKLALVNDIISICGNIGCLDKKLNLKSGGKKRWHGGRENA